MPRFLTYNPEQAYLLPPSVQDELGDDHLCFFICKVVARLDMSGFEQAYSEEGGALYAPQLMLSVWLYAYALGITSARRLEQRLVEDLAFRYLAGGERVDNWALSAFRRRHGRALNDVFTQILELGCDLGLGKWGRVAIDSTRLKANACRDRVDTEQKLRNERVKLRRQVRRWQKACEADDQETGGLQLAVAQAEERLAEMPRRLEKLRKSGLKKLSRTDEDARFLRERGGFVLGYTGEIAVSDDHLIVAQRVTQQAHDVHSLLPLVEAVEQQCHGSPQQVLADSGFFSLANVTELERRGGGSVGARFESGARVKYRAALSGAQPPAARGAETDATKTAQSGRPRPVCAAQGGGGTSVWGAETTTRNAAVPDARPAKGSGGVHAGGSGLQPDAVVPPGPRLSRGGMGLRIRHRVMRMRASARHRSHAVTYVLG